MDSLKSTSTTGLAREKRKAVSLAPENGLPSAKRVKITAQKALPVVDLTGTEKKRTLTSTPLSLLAINRLTRERSTMDRMLKQMTLQQLRTLLVKTEVKKTLWPIIEIYFLNTKDPLWPCLDKFAHMYGVGGHSKKEQFQLACKRVSHLARFPWFFGAAEISHVPQRLAHNGAGSFYVGSKKAPALVAVAYPETDKPPHLLQFTFTGRDNEVKVARIHPNRKDIPKPFKSVDAFVSAASKQLTTPLPGSPFALEAYKIQEIHP